MIDHRALLVKYIAHVGNCEGTTFTSDHHRSGYGHSTWTDEEWAELQALDAESTL